MTKEFPEETKCHIHNKVYDFEINDIHKNVCVNDLPIILHSDEKYYCLFHLPTETKDTNKFMEIFWSKFDTVKQKIGELEKLPKEVCEKAKEKLSYDFRYVFFPSAIDITNGYEFKVKVDFQSATFAKHFALQNVKFSNDVIFRGAVFTQGAFFGLIISFGEVSFIEAIFNQGVNFHTVIFFQKSFFSLTVFNQITYFNEVTFVQDVDFVLTKFSETSQTVFSQTRFCKNVDFENSVCAGYIAFEGKRDEYVFLDNISVKKHLNEKVPNRISEFTYSQISINFEENQEAVLNLQNMRLENPDRVTFHRVHLRPSWFVNVDSREIVFTDVNWINLDNKFDNANIFTELYSLEEREVSEPNRLLEIACHQLSVNAEENNRYEEASKFRYMAMEIKRLEYYWKGKFWTLNWWYQFSSGYGENWRRAVLVLFAVILFFAVLFASPLSTFDYGERKELLYYEQIDSIEKLIYKIAENAERFHNMSLFEGFVHSLYVSALQRPEPKPADVLTRLFVILETIFGPLQAALLALAIRRKFMR